MKNQIQKLLLIAVIVGLCLAAILGRDLRLGKDLRGGVSLIYTVDIAANDPDPSTTLQRVIEVLKDRVNPRGVYDISMEPLGRDRIEIVMPLPTPEVLELQRAFEERLRAVVIEAEISRGELDEALREGTAVARFGGREGSARRTSIESLQRKYDEREAARRSLAALPADATPEIRRSVEFDVAETTIEYQELYESVLLVSLPEARLRRTLALPTTPQRTLDPDGRPVLDERGRYVMRESLREEAVTVLLSEYPDLADSLRELVSAHDAYAARRTGLDDPQDLERLLRGAGVLEFRIAVQAADPEGVDAARLRERLLEGGPENVPAGTARWYPIHQMEQWYDTPAELATMEREPASYFASRYGLIAERYDGTIYLLLWTTPARSMVHGGAVEWSLTQAFRTIDELSRPAVGFNFDAAGAGMMGRLTGGNMGRPMAILLDGMIYSAPAIRGQITSSGQITGKFTQADINYLVKVLGAGSLAARLSESPISTSVLGPSIGADNLQRGREAFILAIIAVAVFMTAYYFFAGLVANLALVLNGIIIFGVMMAIDGTFTLPGLAGIVLTIGMAVDANVLIYERIREELINNREDLRTSVRLGYSKALSTIMDGNITNLIVCFALFQTATTEVKGFALTLTIGILATLFTALFVTRQVFHIYVDRLKIRRLSMLPIAIPSIHRALEPSIDWIRMRPVFFIVSGVAMLLSVIAITSRGADMLDTEFRGGVSLVMRTAVEGDGRRILPHVGTGSVLSRVRAIGAQAPDPAAAADPGERVRRLILREMANATVYTVGDTGTSADGTLGASAFQIKVASPEGIGDESTNAAVVVEAIIDAFGGDLDVVPPIRFAGAESDSPFGGPTRVYPISAGQSELGQVIGRPGLRQRTAPFIGGVVLLLQDVQPAASPAEVQARIDRMRNQPDFQRLAGRRCEVVGVTAVDPEDPRKGYTELAVLVLDASRSYLDVPGTLSLEVWQREVATAEWGLARRALLQPSSLDQVSTFSSAIAQTLKANAVVAVSFSLFGILIYIWVRFGSLRYSLAAVAALGHDVVIALGLLAWTGTLAETGIGRALGIEPFRIELGVIAALLTIIGYSLNDTIVVLDRIRENRGKLPLATSRVINLSINQTVSRTLLTSGTTLIAVVIMYAEGGSGIRPFTFCLLAGIIVGTYSSIAIAAPLVHGREQGARPAASPASGGTAALPEAP